MFHQTKMHRPEASKREKVFSESADSFPAQDVNALVQDINDVIHAEAKRAGYIVPQSGEELRSITQSEGDNEVKVDKTSEEMQKEVGFTSFR